VQFEKQAVAAREKFLVEKSKYDASQPPKPEAPPKKEKKEKAAASSEVCGSRVFGCVCVCVCVCVSVCDVCKKEAQNLFI
jgi:hypothetical protein